MDIETNGFLDFGRFTLRISDRVLLAGGRVVSLSPRAFELLHYFVTNAGALLGREQLKLSVWGTINVSDNSIDQKIAELRKVFAQVDPSTEYIQNKHGQGWCFIVTVEKRTAEPVGEAPEPPRTGWSWKIYAALAAGVAILAGAAVRIAGMHGAEPSIAGYRQLTYDGLHKMGRLFTDGRMVYFTEAATHDAKPELLLAAVPLGGGDVEYPPTPVWPAILFDIAAGTGDRLYGAMPQFEPRVPLLLWRSKPGLLEGIGTVSDASIAPDGRSVAYGDEFGNLSIQELGPSPTVRRIRVPGDQHNSIWSNDGKRIRFSVVDPTSESAALWEIRRDGSGLHRLPIPVEHGRQLAPEGWTADGRYFIFTEYGVLDHHSSLWIVPDDPLGLKRAKPVRLTSAPMDFRAAVAAPDGSTLFAIGSKSRNELVQFDSEKRAFVPLWESLPAIDVLFSNDGAGAAFVRYPEYTLWVSRADGSDRRQITFAPLVAHQPHWSPDGRRIAFMGQMPGKPWRIYIVPVSGGVPQEVKPNDALDQGVPSWSADGRSLVFGELRLRKPDAKMTIRVLDLATGNENVIPGSLGKWSPRWSPDGRTILAATTDFKGLDLFDCKTQTWKPLARAAAINDAVWSLDSKFVHFQANTEQGRALLRVRIDDGMIEQLALEPEIEFSWSGVAPDGSPLMLRAVKIEDIYALDLKLR